MVIWKMYILSSWYFRSFSFQGLLSSMLLWLKTVMVQYCLDLISICKYIIYLSGHFSEWAVIKIYSITIIFFVYIPLCNFLLKLEWQKNSSILTCFSVVTCAFLLIPITVLFLPNYIRKGLYATPILIIDFMQLKSL